MARSFSLLVLLSILLTLTIVSAASLTPRKPAKADATDLPLRSACSTSLSCESDYCKHGYCARPKAVGEACYKNAGCKSRLCDKQAGRCVPLTAHELLRLTEPVKETSAFHSVVEGPVRFDNKLTISKYGLVEVNKQSSPAHGGHKQQKHRHHRAQFKVSSTSPAVLRTHFTEETKASGDSALFFSYKVVDFARTHKHPNAHCHLSTLFNGHALSLPIAIHRPLSSSSKGEEDGEVHHAAFTLAYKADLRNIAIAIKCDRHAKATIEVSNMRIEEWMKFEEEHQKVL